MNGVASDPTSFSEQEAGNVFIVRPSKPDLIYDLFQG